MSRLLLFLVSSLALAAMPSAASAQDDADKDVRLGVTTTVGNLGLSMTNLGYFGSFILPTVTYPSCEWPRNSNVEHMSHGGIWIGAINAEGDTLVTAGTDDYSGSPGKAELGPRTVDTVTTLSSNPLSPRYSTRAKADQQFEFACDDYNPSLDQRTDDPHEPLGVRVHTTAFAYAPQYADDFVILNFDVENISGTELTDVYLGWYCELSVGNASLTPVGGQPSWNWFDDKNSYIGPGDLQDDPDIRLFHCHDPDGEDGRAASWIGVRYLGATFSPDVFSFRQWTFNGGEYPRYDRPKYEAMASGRIDVGESEGGIDFDVAINWSNMIAVGPWPTLFPDEHVGFTLAIVAGADSTDMVRNSQIAQSTFDRGFELPAGPPSPRLSITTADNAVILRWDPGIDSDDPTLASPEFHRSDFTNEYDFQGYRIYRIQSETVTGDPFEQASLVAEFDRTEWPDGTPDREGFNVGLPPLNGQGQREFVDRDVLNGFSYRYSVTSFATRNPRLGLPELESGFNENSQLVVPGSAPGGAPAGNPKVGVYPNPYRATSLFGGTLPSGEPAELGRQLYFTNVPARCVIEIFNLAGSRVDRIERHDSTTGQQAWDMLSENTRAIAPGLYVYVVQDLETGERQRGKLVILK